MLPSRRRPDFVSVCHGIAANGGPNAGSFGRERRKINVKPEIGRAGAMRHW
jgi:hypothetical protein